MGLRVASCGDDMLQFRRCLAASFFLNAALKQPEGTYRYECNLEMRQLKFIWQILKVPLDFIAFNKANLHHLRILL